DVSVVHLRNAELFRCVIPSKIFESFAMGLPILIGVPEGEATEIVRQSGAGIVIPPEDAKIMAAEIQNLADDSALCLHLRAKGIAAAVKYDRSTLADSMLGVIKETIKISGE